MMYLIEFKAENKEYDMNIDTFTANFNTAWKTFFHSVMTTSPFPFQKEHFTTAPLLQYTKRRFRKVEGDFYTSVRNSLVLKESTVQEFCKNLLQAENLTLFSIQISEVRDLFDITVEKGK